MRPWVQTTAPKEKKKDEGRKKERREIPPTLDVYS
jgi:hypothetical protein